MNNTKVHVQVGHFTYKKKIMNNNNVHVQVGHSTHEIIIIMTQVGHFTYELSPRALAAEIAKTSLQSSANIAASATADAESASFEPVPMKAVLGGRGRGETACVFGLSLVCCGSLGVQMSLSLSLCVCVCVCVCMLPVCSPWPNVRNCAGVCVCVCARARARVQVHI